MEWKKDHKDFSLIKIHSIETRENQDLINNVNENDISRFDSQLFLKNVCLLIDQKQYDKIFEIESQLSNYDMSLLPVVRNSRLLRFLCEFVSLFFDDEKNSQNFSCSFILSCLKICAKLTSNNQKETKIILMEIINEKLVNSLFLMIQNENLHFYSLWIFSNIFYLNEGIFIHFYRDIINLLMALSSSHDIKTLSLLSLILKRFTTSLIFEVNYNFDSWFQIAQILLQCHFPYIQYNVIHGLSKIIRKLPNIFNQYNDFIIHLIDEWKENKDEIIFGSILYLLLSILEINESNSYSFTQHFNKIPFCDIIKNGLMFCNSSIQAASAEILCIFIGCFPSFIPDLFNSDIIETIFQIADISEFRGKQKVRKVLCHMFWRNDFIPIFPKIFLSGGIQFLCDNLQTSENCAKDIFPILNRIIILFPNQASVLINNGIIDQLDSIICENETTDLNTSISAQALKSDLLTLHENIQDYI
ncbi:hypothetical protein TRFO_34983 [Tritrichomonas foetus]|uniref:Uncharacterized protein n=1 Tax=Tritrichomonas foetus TaxID=1144522 RepID=A0A1J4JMY7_9EUKA|nr:hypothetical protein TRFO_34983 [Tritrichomonas foetus]|eukprot:OHS98612.1 hypothetical protein TRFO_34983 [Tritrichomonas foetus]